MILFSGSVVCNDESKSRLMRMKGIFSMYLPHADREKITTSLKSGLEFKSPEFDKVTWHVHVSECIFHFLGYCYHFTIYIRTKPETY